MTPPLLSYFAKPNRDNYVMSMCHSRGWAMDKDKSDKRGGDDRRQDNDPDYTGPERRQGDRRRDKPAKP